MEVCWVLFCLSNTPAKCVSWLRTDYLPMQMTPHIPAVVRKPADRPAVAASRNRDLARIQEWCNHWCMIVSPNKTKSLVVSRSRIVSPSHGDLVLSGVSIRASTNLDNLGVKFESKRTFKDHMRGIVSHVSRRIRILRLVKRIFVDISVLLRCYFVSVLPILKHCSPVWGSAAECHLRLLGRQVYSVAQALSRSEFLVVMSSTSCVWA